MVHLRQVHLGQLPRRRHPTVRRAGNSAAPPRRATVPARSPWSRSARLPPSSGAPPRRGPRRLSTAGRATTAASSRGPPTALPTSAGSAATKVSSAIWMLFMAYKLHICRTPGPARPTRLTIGKAASTCREAKIVREYSVPASFTVGEHDNIVSSVFSHERDDPDHVIFQRLVDGAWTDVTCKRRRPTRSVRPHWV